MTAVARSVPATSFVDANAPTDTSDPSERGAVVSPFLSMTNRVVARMVDA